MIFNISFATRDDIPQLAEIERSCFSFPHTEEQIFHELTDSVHYYLIAKSGEELVGYVSMAKIIDEVYIGNVAVKEGFRREGVGDTLINALIYQCREDNCSFITLEVRNENYPAINLYKKHGSSITGIIKDYYSSPKDDAVIMTIDIKKD